MPRSLASRLAPFAALGALFAVAGFAASVSPTAADVKPPLAGVWTVDPMHTQCNFTITHMLISQVQGRFADLSGEIVADPALLAKSSVTFTIQATSIDTQVAARDADLRKKDYFDVADYPTITFVSTKIAKAKPGSELPYVAFGNLTIKGVTRPIALPFVINGPIMDPWKNPRFGLITHISIDRTKFGVGGNEFGMLGKDVKIDISLEAIPAKKPA